MRTYEKTGFQKDEAIFFLAFTIYITSIAVGRTTFVMERHINAEKYLQLLRYGSYILFCLKFLITGYYNVYKRNQILPAVTALLIVAIIVITNNKSLLMVSFVFFAALHMSMKRVLKAYEIVIGALLVVNVLFSCLGISTNYLFDATTRHRLGLGYNWTTVAPITYMFLVFGYLYLRQNNTHVWEYIILLAAAVWFFLQTDTKFAFLITVLYIVICFFNQYMNRSPWLVVKTIGKYNLLIPIIIALVSIILYFLYVPESVDWQKINTLLSDRLRYGYNAIRNYKITLFGQKIEWAGHGIQQELNSITHSDDFLDSAYIRNLYLYGFFGLSLILYVYILGIYKSIKHEDWHMLTIYLFVLTFCIFEFWIDKVDVNPFTVLAVTDFAPSNKNRPISFQGNPLRE